MNACITFWELFKILATGWFLCAILVGVLFWLSKGRLLTPEELADQDAIAMRIIDADKHRQAQWN